MPHKCRTRKENLARALEHESCGNSSAAYECYQKAVDISPSIAHELIMVSNELWKRSCSIFKRNQFSNFKDSSMLYCCAFSYWHGWVWKVLKQENVCYVVAPYEADAQMTFLAISKQVDAVITEDSDLIPFGCPRVSLYSHWLFNFILHFL